MKIPDNELAVLSAATVEGNVLFLNSGQLDRKTYVMVDKVLKAMGGKWDRKAKGHVFQEDPTDKLEDVLLTGSVSTHKEFGFFETPPNVVEMMLDFIEPVPGMLALEPSAGKGAIVQALANILGKESVHCVEVNEERHAFLKKEGFPVGKADFLKVRPEKRYSAVVMNPPFERQQDIDHVLYAFQFLKEGGRLAAVMGAGVLFRENKKTVKFREWLDEVGGDIEKLPEGSFKPSGTMVNTVLVTIGK